MTDPASAYRVLARKYRPQTFAELIGQEAMVRTLTNAIASDRIAHAFILTGVRGVGKTTTARIIARALNCTGPDGTGGPTVAPCGVCDHCRAIAEDRHVDVIEMDAASRSKVEEMRDLLDGVRYRPVSARYKVYIIDEIHMLSGHSFNALLKTLEEPPPDVKFVFATTEIHKVPVTVLSRCQRFALRRVPVDLLIEHYRRIADAEGIAAEPAALALIARAADGSVRDGLSLLDQAIALGGGRVDEAAVRDMLGVADRGQVFDLLESLLCGDAAAALERLDQLYEGGADPFLVLQDLLDLGHFLVRLKLTPAAGAGDPVAEGERERARPFAAKLSMPALTQLWQMLLKGIGEVQLAPSPIQAAEMVLVRLAYVADLPSPADLVRRLAGSGAAANPLPNPPPPAGEGAGKALPPPAAEGSAAEKPAAEGPAGEEPAGEEVRRLSAATAPSRSSPPPQPAETPRSIPASQAREALQSFPPPQAGEARVGAAPAPAARSALDAVAAPGPALEPMPQSFLEVVQLFDRRREAVTRAQLWSHLHLVHFEPGRIECRLAEAAPRDLANRLGQLLGEWTGMRWLVALTDAAGAPTLREQEEERARALRSEVAADPLVRAVLDAFPGATIAAVREHFAAEGGPDDETDDEDST
jgi:DNA polymerase III subunit gamma/tau